MSAEQKRVTPAELKELIGARVRSEVEDHAGASAEHRLRALSAFEALGFPTQRHEEWKYTNILRSLPSVAHGPASVEAVALRAAIDAESGYTPQGIRISVVNGEVVLPEELPAGVTVEITELPHPADIGRDATVALAAALSGTSVTVRIAAGISVETPLVLEEMVGYNQENISSVQWNIDVARSASAVFERRHASAGAHTGLRLSLASVAIAEGATAEYVVVQQEAPSATLLTHDAVEVEAGANFHAVTYTLSGKVVRNDLAVTLKGSTAHARFHGLYVPKRGETFDNHTTVDHAVPHCTSDELYKGILLEKGTGVFNGKIIVRKDAQKTNAFQSNRNILTSDTAAINTKPQLEIFADDVKCSHGATTGFLDEESLFYLRARGLSRSQAEALLLEAFASEITALAHNDVLRRHLARCVADALLSQA